MLGETISAPFCGKMGTTVSAYAAGLCRASSVETSNTAKGKGVVTQAKGPVLVVSWDLLAIRGDQEIRKAVCWTQRGQDSSSSQGVAGVIYLVSS